ncbi:hypothetical protein E5676_scaffold828G00480 [Cucumis melo var. makuwa]|uniref:Uncharacterized protein n=1 Tax=Cucumis melo var. makuwa TaxID=1194695 RepID=A0A5D3CKH4_CUCMM|nr:hypothetical protein E5676_scaffold828G00480 [Cucumis melo var. makuwa]
MSRASSQGAEHVHVGAAWAKARLAEASPMNFNACPIHCPLSALCKEVSMAKLLSPNVSSPMSFLGFCLTSLKAKALVHLSQPPPPIGGDLACIDLVSINLVFGQSIMSIDRVYDFLAGLNSKFDVVRSRILRQGPVPLIWK